MINRYYKKVKNLLNFESKLLVNFKKIKISLRIENLNNLTINSIISGISDEKYDDHELVVSLTTYGKRLSTVYLAIESIMQQSLKANRIVLWLSEDLEGIPLPGTLVLQQKRGLEVRYCKDLRSYKKLIPSLKAFPDAVIITVDDDVIYDIDLIDTLYRSYIEDPNSISYCRGHKIKLDAAGNIMPYKQWYWYQAEPQSSKFNFPTGVGGVLYPPYIFNEEVFNEAVFFSICQSADDVWFKAMGLYNGKLTKKAFTKNEKGEEYLELEDLQDMALMNINNGQGLNDIQIKAVFEKYNLLKL